MATTIDLRTIVQNGDPKEEGRRLADVLLSYPDSVWAEVTIETDRLPLELFNASFFFTFLRRVAAARPELLDAARRVRWSSPYIAVFSDAVPRLMEVFRPEGVYLTRSHRNGARS